MTTYNQHAVDIDNIQKSASAGQNINLSDLQILFSGNKIHSFGTSCTPPPLWFNDDDVNIRNVEDWTHFTSITPTISVVVSRKMCNRFILNSDCTLNFSGADFVFAIILEKEKKKLSLILLEEAGTISMTDLRIVDIFREEAPQHWCLSETRITLMLFWKTTHGQSANHRARCRGSNLITMEAVIVDEICWGHMTHRDTRPCLHETPSAKAIGAIAWLIWHAHTNGSTCQKLTLMAGGAIGLAFLGRWSH
ncbi:hypothetical protein B0H17DRAFT_1141613 [Mycena rosella]|uniref:Uncharacterized protein n=1 Tax=Mycena rosella TaxID=1033263 RepID=A0AAD7D2X0_MYCRO|nr:hypothetical protein B0H17DRAFT_1141613 [Mycena rosella]